MPDGVSTAARSSHSSSATPESEPSPYLIVKLPFSVPTDPVFAARSELLDDPFSAYAVPQAALRLKQGFGRLIRSTSDRGVVAILDSRLWTKRYGETLLRSLPDATCRRCAWQELGGLIADWLARPK